MDLQQFVQLFLTENFSVVAYGALFWFTVTKMDKFSEALDKNTKLIEQLMLVLQKERCEHESERNKDT